MDPKNLKKKKRRDPFVRLKYIGYRMIELPDSYTPEQLLNFAKFQLAQITGTLLKDPIWDKYTSEELLAEFYAYQFSDEQFKKTFEAENDDINGKRDSFSDWADEMIEKDNKEIKKLGERLEDNIKFSPNDVMGDD